MKSKMFLKIFDALATYAHSQEECEAMTNAVLKALNKK